MSQDMDSKKRWWSALTDECPITLEPLCELPYPPFILADGGGGGKSCNYYFDGLALATYTVSQGSFTNPLTRMPLDYDTCIRLDEYLDEHIYNGSQNYRQHQLASIVGQRDGMQEPRLSVKEAWLLRDSIKVKVGSGENESDVRRAEALRNEASVALRGLFVFGHESGRHDNSWTTAQESSNQNQSAFARAPGGFNLNYNPNSLNLAESMQDGLRIIDDDEAAFEAADAADAAAVQAAFPPLNGGSNQSHQNYDNIASSQLLETVRQTANMTILEETEKAKRLERQRQQYYLQALERKRQRIVSRRNAKEEAARALSREKEANDMLQYALNEIDQWREQQWQEWERAASIHKSKVEAEDASPSIKSRPENEVQKDNQQSISEPTPEEKEARAAAKKKAKRQKAKERAKEKKRLEKIEADKKEKALALQKEKEKSALKCGACGVGILGCGFEKVCQPGCM